MRPNGNLRALPAPARVTDLIAKISAHGILMDADAVRASANGELEERDQRKLDHLAQTLEDREGLSAEVPGAVRVRSMYTRAERTHHLASLPNVRVFRDQAPEAFVTTPGHQLVEIDAFVGPWEIIADVTGDPALTAALGGDVYANVTALLAQEGVELDRWDTKVNLFRWFFAMPPRVPVSGEVANAFARALPKAARFRGEVLSAGGDLFEFHRTQNAIQMDAVVDAWEAISSIAGVQPAALLDSGTLVVEVPTENLDEVANALRSAGPFGYHRRLSVEVSALAGPTLGQLAPLVRSAEVAAA